MSFRQFGGLNYASKFNMVSANYNSSNNLQVPQNVGQPNSHINFLSNVNVQNTLTVSGTATINNANLTGIATAATPALSTNDSQLATTAFVNNYMASFLSLMDPSSVYLTSASASSTYLTISNAASTYLAITDASSTYLTISNASSTYLTSSAASSTYLTIPNASSTYLAITDASSTYSPINNPTFTGVVTAPSFNTTSDYRIKENVQTLNDQYIVDNLRPVTYINATSKKQDIGLIAHELQENYPFLVNGVKDGEQSQSVNYIGLIGILINEVKTLKKEINFMRKNLNVLK